MEVVLDCDVLRVVITRVAPNLDAKAHIGRLLSMHLIIRGDRSPAGDTRGRTNVDDSPLCAA